MRFSAAALILALTFATGTLCASAANDASYRISPGDQLAVAVFGDTSLTQTVTVLPDGLISLPLIGNVRVGGITTQSASTTIAHALARYVRHPIVTVALTTQGTMNVLVLGDVKTPGKYAVRSNARLSDAIAAAGGLGDTNGDLPVARIASESGAIKRASLQSLLRDGDESQNLPITDGSVVYVQGPATYEIEVVGAVDHPGYIPLSEGDRLSVAIAKAGNSVGAAADLSHVFVTRASADGRAMSHEVDMYEALERGDLRYDPVLKKGDIVYVPQAKNTIQNNGGFFSLLRRIFFRF